MSILVSVISVREFVIPYIETMIVVLSLKNVKTPVKGSAKSSWKCTGVVDGAYRPVIIV